MSIADQLAFPALTQEMRGESGEKWHTDYGLTKREFFAAKAMQGLLAANWEAPPTELYTRLAGHSVACADALIAELGK